MRGQWEQNGRILCVDEGKSTECGSRFHVDKGGGESNMADFEPGHLFTDVRVGKVELSLEKLSLSCYLVFIFVNLLGDYYVLDEGIQR